MEGTRTFDPVHPAPEYVAAQVDGSTGRLKKRPMKNCGIARINSLISNWKTLFQRVPAKAYQKQRSCSSESGGV